MDLIGPPQRSRPIPVQQVLLEVGLAGGRQERGHPVHVVHDLVGDRTRLDVAGPPHHGRHPPAALPIGVLLTAERRPTGIGPGVHVRPVVGAVEDEGVVRDAELVEQVEELTDVHVVLHHAVGVLVLARDAPVLLLDVRAEVHARAAPPHEEGRPRCVGIADEAHGGCDRLIVYRLHALLGEWPGVLDPAVGVAVDHTPRAESLREGPILGIVLVLRLLLGVQMIEVAEELVEAVVCGQELILVPEVVLAELTRGVTQVLEEHGDRRVLFAQPQVRAGHTHLAESGAEHALSGDERRTAGRAALLAVVVGEDHTLVGNAVDVGCPVTHEPHGVGADVCLSDVVAPDD